MFEREIPGSQRERVGVFGVFGGVGNPEGLVIFPAVELLTDPTDGVDDGDGDDGGCDQIGNRNVLGTISIMKSSSIHRPTPLLRLNWNPDEIGTFFTIEIGYRFRSPNRWVFSIGSLFIKCRNRLHQDYMKY